MPRQHLAEHPLDSCHCLIDELQLAGILSRWRSAGIADDLKSIPDVVVQLGYGLHSPAYQLPFRFFISGKSIEKPSGNAAHNQVAQEDCALAEKPFGRQRQIESNTECGDEQKHEQCE